ncbi:MAG TPA: hypothetical protein VNS09_00010 [Solirubrobacter sp.]|nr:hypothetical protein [Solirubrobacter sp.]
MPALAEAAADEPDLAAVLVDELRDCEDPATFGAAVNALPRAAGRVADTLVPMLLAHARSGSGSPAAAHIAARAVVAATAVALASERPMPAARVALELADAAPALPDTVAQAAVRAAGALINALPQDGAVREAVTTILDGLADRGETEVEVAFERAHLCLVDALGEPNGDLLRVGLVEAQQRFDDVLAMEADRVDAAIVTCALRAVTAFAADEPVADRAAQLEALCDERAMYGTSAGDHISRRPAEDAWRHLGRTLASSDRLLDNTAWLDPVAALTLLIDAVRLSRTQRIGGADLGVLVMPRIRAPFVETEHLRGLLRNYIETLVDDPRRAETATELLLSAEQLPKVDGSEPDAHLLRALQDTGLDAAQAEAVVATRDALTNAAHVHRGRQWWEAYAQAATALINHPDHNTRAGQTAGTVLVHVLDFIADRFNMTRGSRPHLQYLADPHALEQALADDLVTHLRYWLGEHIRTETTDIGGGRVDVVIDLGDDRVVSSASATQTPGPPARSTAGPCKRTPTWPLVRASACSCS